MDTLLAVGSQGAFSNRPSAVFGVQRDAPTPKSYNYSIGVQRELGWGTVIDVTYAGFQMRDAEMNKTINTVPDGARFIDVNPQNVNPQNPTTAKPAEFLRPYMGYQQITIREHFGTATTTPCSCSSTAATSTACSSPWPILSARPSATAPTTTRFAPGRRGTKAPTARRSSTTS